MRRFRPLAMAAAMLAAGGCSTIYYPRDLSPQQTAAQQRSADRALARWTTDRLETFADEAEFRAYLRAARRAAVARDMHWAGVRRHRVAGDGQEVVVTGSRIPPRNASITNVQEAGVDEGDIVKQIDRFLIVLQDGRLFAIDPGARQGAALRLTDRMNVYRQVPSDRHHGTWYDEMLVLGDRIVVTGYSYPERASEISVFRLDEAGRFTREGTFFLSSNDYYDTRNYATRLVDGNLLIYTPLALNEIHPGRPIPWPSIRRWQPGEATPAPDDDVEAARFQAGRGRPLLAPTDIYRPLLTTVEPTVHSFTLCPLGPDAAGRDLQCRSTAFIGGGSWRRFYVSPTDIFLVTGPGSDDLAAEGTQADDPACGHERPPLADVWPTQVYRVPVRGGAPGVVGVRGAPFDQFSMQARDGHFRLLMNWGSMRCGTEYRERVPPVHFTLLHLPPSSFSGTPREAAPGAYTALPSIGAEIGMVADRFTERYVVYGSLGMSRFREDDTPRSTLIGVVPIDRPAAAQVLSVPHNVIRAEQAGENIVLTGYHSRTAGLDVSLIDLRAAPRVAATHSFARRHESEGRSHAFNSLLDRDGAGLLALPTVPLTAGGERMPSWSRPSDMEFLRLSSAGVLAEAGRLETSVGVREDPNDHSVPGYTCEVSCTDWYGNSRPIFTDGRIFALLGTELIEGRLAGGQISEVQRLDIVRVPVPGR